MPIVLHLVNRLILPNIVSFISNIVHFSSVLFLINVRIKSSHSVRMSYAIEFYSLFNVKQEMRTDFIVLG